jgi:hypothetical protein
MSAVTTNASTIKERGFPASCVHRSTIPGSPAANPALTITVQALKAVEKPVAPLSL